MALVFADAPLVIVALAAVGAVMAVGDFCCNVKNTKDALKYNATDPVLADRYGKAHTISDTLRLNGYDEAAKFVDTISLISAVGVGVNGLLESAGKFAGKLGSIRDIFKNIFKSNYRNEQAEIRERVLKNIEESRRAREVSNYKEFAEYENRFRKANKTVTRQLDEVVDKEFLEKMKATKNNLSSKIKSNVNFGYAYVDIEGIEKTEFYAHSAVNELNEFKSKYNVSEDVIKRMTDISLVPSKRIFNTLKVDGRNIVGGEKAWDRIVDSESKILHEIAEKLGEKPEVTGRIKLYTDYDCCPSCQYVIKQFRERYPKIDIEVIYKKKK